MVGIMKLIRASFFSSFLESVMDSNKNQRILVFLVNFKEKFRNERIAT